MFFDTKDYVEEEVKSLLRYWDEEGSLLNSINISKECRNLSGAQKETDWQQQVTHLEFGTLNETLFQKASQKTIYVAFLGMK